MEELKDLIRAQVPTANKLYEREGVMISQQAEMLKDHERRLRIIERTIAYGAGAIGIILYLAKTLGK